MALDDNGNVWILGGYTEEYEGGEYTNAESAWLGSAEGQMVGILAPGEVTMDTPRWCIGAAPHPSSTGSATSSSAATARRTPPTSPRSTSPATRASPPSAPAPPKRSVSSRPIPTAVLVSRDIASFLRAQPGDTINLLLARATEDQVGVDARIVGLDEHTRRVPAKAPPAASARVHHPASPGPRTAHHPPTHHRPVNSLEPTELLRDE